MRPGVPSEYPRAASSPTAAKARNIIPDQKSFGARMVMTLESASASNARSRRSFRFDLALSDHVLPLLEFVFQDFGAFFGAGAARGDADLGECRLGLGILQSHGETT